MTCFKFSFGERYVTWRVFRFRSHALKQCAQPVEVMSLAALVPPSVPEGLSGTDIASPHQKGPEES
jgi:hypothetical protein